MMALAGGYGVFGSADGSARRSDKKPSTQLNQAVSASATTTARYT